MAKFLIEVKEGETSGCAGCPFSVPTKIGIGCNGWIGAFMCLDCKKYDLRTLKITEVKD